MQNISSSKSLPRSLRPNTTPVQNLNPQTRLPNTPGIPYETFSRNSQSPHPEYPGTLGRRNSKQRIVSTLKNFGRQNSEQKEEIKVELVFYGVKKNKKLKKARIYFDREQVFLLVKLDDKDFRYFDPHTPEFGYCSEHDFVLNFNNLVDKNFLRKFDEKQTAALDNCCMEVKFLDEKIPEDVKNYDWLIFKLSMIRFKNRNDAKRVYQEFTGFIGKNTFC